MGIEPSVTIVIPTYQRMEYLAEAIRSALAQTYQDLEVIVSDNAASNEVRALVDSYRDARLRYRCNETNTGAMGNAIAAYREARGRFIGTMHDDDTWEPEAVERLVAPLLHDDSLVVSFSDYWHMGADGVIDVAMSQANSTRFKLDQLGPGVHCPFLQLALVDECIPLVICALFRKDAVDWDLVRLEASPLTDRWMNYLLARTGRGCFYVKERLTRYRVHGGSISSVSRTPDAVAFCLRQWLADPVLTPVHEQLQRSLAEAHRLTGLEELRSGRRREARIALRSSLAEGGGRRTRALLSVAVLPRPLGATALQVWNAATTLRHGRNRLQRAYQDRPLDRG